MSEIKIGATCPALTKENYEYHLSGDAADYCRCILNGRACSGRVISDPDEASSRFFSRGKCSISQKGLEKCPLYGGSKEVFIQILKDKSEKDLEGKLKHFKINDEL